MPATNRSVSIAPDATALFRQAAQTFLAHAEKSVADRGRFTVALSGGSTPKGMFSLLVTDPLLRNGMPWGQTHFFWGDERHVPPDSSESNYAMARQTMLGPIGVPAKNIHRIRSELPDAHDAASEYETQLRSFFQSSPGQFPRFDLVLLGMGSDAHTASLFPHTEALHERHKLVAANWVEKFKTWRITLTLSVINNAANVLFLVSGSEKAEALKTVLKGPHHPELYPAQLIRPTDGTLTWLVDSAFASLLQ